MIRLKINKMCNAFGIKSLKVNFGKDNSLYQALIYSPNGIFKTSFSKTLYCISTQNTTLIEDRITHTASIIDLNLVDNSGNLISNDLTGKIIVFSRELYSNNDLTLNTYSDELRFLTTDKESKDKLNKILFDSVNKMKLSLKTKLKSAQLNEEKSMMSLNMKNIDDLELTDLEELCKMVSATEERDISKIDTKKIFQKAYDPIDNEQFLEAAKNYVSIYEKRLSEELFDGNFNDNNCLSFVENIKESGFLNQEKKRGLYLKDKIYYNIEDIEKLFKESIANISKEPQILAANRQLVKTMGNSQEANKLKEKFHSDPMLINQLSLGRKKIILIVLKLYGLETETFLKEIEDIKKEYTKIILEAKTKQSEFEKAIKIYKSRFNPIFDVEIKNKEESVLGTRIPILIFRHNRVSNVELNENEIRTILSSGEKTALNIISFIVNYEAKKNNDPIIILDDIVETFDYANRYAFIEYIKDMVNDNASIIVLTHNYEFYRTLGKRIPELDKLSAYSKNGDISIEKNKKLNRDIEKIFEITNESQLILSIPYLREIKVMLKQDTNILDCCLHYKRRTNDITVKELINEYNISINVSINDTKKYIDLLYEVADNINISNLYDIESKTILSIACRLLLESKIVGDKFELVDHIMSYQLATIKDENINYLSDTIIQLIDKVQISTPEFIHVNSFMYEPLIDINGKYLLDIYKQIKDIKETEIWK